jgi:hypothetical protein
MATQRERVVSTRRRLGRGQAGRLLGAAALVATAWLVSSPRLQRARQIEQVTARPEAAGDAIYALCRTEGGSSALIAALEGADEATRAAALRVAAAQGCLSALPGGLRAQHAAGLAEPASSAQIAGAASQGVEAAINGLESEDEAQRAQALRALVSLEPLLTLDQRRRAQVRLAQRPHGAPALALLAESLADAPRALPAEDMGQALAPTPEEPAPEEPAPEEGLRMPQLGESLRVGNRGVLYVAPAGGE